MDLQSFPGLQTLALGMLTSHLLKLMFTATKSAHRMLAMGVGCAWERDLGCWGCWWAS